MSYGNNNQYQAPNQNQNNYNQNQPQADYQQNNQPVDNGAMDWDDEISKDEPLEFVTFEAGIYRYLVTNVEKLRHTPNPNNLNAKIKIVCPKAVVHIRITHGEHTINIKENMILHRNLENLIGGMFRSAGLRQQGEKLIMKWNELPGCSGFVKLSKTQGKTNKDRWFNNVVAWLPPESQQQQPQQNYQQMPQQQMGPQLPPQNNQPAYIQKNF